MSLKNEEEFVRTITSSERPIFVDLEELVLGDDGQPTHDAVRSQAQKLASTLDEQAHEARIFRDSTPPAPSPPLEDPLLGLSASIPRTSRLLN
uniref:Uncharacterized protein n=1 Tax=Cannabis sativa TaxID=3483 RepID=A0A803Q803_CANSA